MTTNEKRLIHQLLQSPQYPVLENLKKEIIDKILADTKVMDTEWDTIKKTLIDEGQVQGINRIFKEIFNSQL